MVGSYIFRAASKILTPQRCLLVSASLFLTSTIIASQVGGLCFSGFLLVIILLPSLCTCDHLVAFQLAMSTTFPSKLGSLLAFVLIEIALGIYFPSIGTLRRYRSYAKNKYGRVPSPVCEMVLFQPLPSWLAPINDHQPISSEFHHYQHNDDHHYNHQYFLQQNNIHRPRPNL